MSRRIKVIFRELERQVGNMRSTNYPVGDFLTRLKNSAMANKNKVVAPKTKMIVAVAEALKSMGYLDSIEVDDKNISVHIKVISKKLIIRDITLVSKPGLRIYKSVDELESEKKPFSYILSTSKGVMSEKEAIKNRVGGEVIAKIL